MRAVLLPLLLVLVTLASPGGRLQLGPAGNADCCEEGVACCCQAHQEAVGSCCPSEAPELLWASTCGCGGDHGVEFHWTSDPFAESPVDQRLTLLRPESGPPLFLRQTPARRFPSPEAPPPRRATT